MIAPRSELAYLQSDFYRQKFRKMLRLLIYAVLVIFALIAADIYLNLYRPSQKYYANTTEGRILPMPTPFEIRVPKSG